VYDASQDRDGTLVKDYPDADWSNVLHLEISPDTISALKKIPDQYKIFIVTNQYLIGEGIISFEQFLTTHTEFISVLGQSGIYIEQTYFCPHSRSISCGCHKPETGMIQQCLTNYDVNIPQSYFIGDSAGDILLAHTIGCKSIAVRDYASTIQPSQYSHTLEDAVTFIQTDHVS